MEPTSSGVRAWDLEAFCFGFSAFDFWPKSGLGRPATQARLTLGLMIPKGLTTFGILERRRSMTTSVVESMSKCRAGFAIFRRFLGHTRQWIFV